MPEEDKDRQTKRDPTPLDVVIPRDSDSGEARGDEADLRLWRMTAAHPGELIRWQSLDGRWVALARGHGISAGELLLVDSRGRCESCADVDAAFALARQWRT
jgi:hypothetical protein